MWYDPRRVRTRVEVNGRPHPVRQPPPVERLGNLSIGLFGGERADVLDERGRSTTQVRRCDGQRTLDLRTGTLKEKKNLGAPRFERVVPKWPSGTRQPEGEVGPSRGWHVGLDFQHCAVAEVWWTVI